MRSKSVFSVHTRVNLTGRTCHFSINSSARLHWHERLVVLKNTEFGLSRGLVSTRGDVKLRNAPANKLTMRIIWPCVALVRDDNLATQSNPAAPGALTTRSGELARSSAISHARVHRSKAAITGHNYKTEQLAISGVGRPGASDQPWQLFWRPEADGQATVMLYCPARAG